MRLTEEELASLQPTDDKTIHVEHFLNPAFVDLTLLAGRTLYLAPANPAARRPLACVLQSLARANKWAIGHVVFSSKLQIVMIRPEDEVLLMHTLYHPSQRRALVHREGSEVEISQHDFTVERLDRYDAGTDQWLEAIVEDRRTSVPDQVAFLIDFPDWLMRLGNQKRRIAEALAMGNSASGVAKRFKLSPCRISQLRGELYRSWQEYHGDPVAAAS